MKRIIQILFSILLLSFFSCGTGNGPVEGDYPITEYRELNDGDRVEVLFFHNHERCSTCLNIEKITIEVVDTYFGEEVDEGRLVLHVIDIEDKKNEDVIDGYEVVWTSLFINRWENGEETINNLTQYAFIYVDSSPEVFREGIRQEIENMLK